MRNMKKALHAKAYPYLAMLEHKNTPSEGMSTSPAQRLFGRRKRCTIPTSRQLLEPICMHSPKQELQQAKPKRAYYYNRGSKKLLALMVGDAVRMMPEKGMKSRRKGKVKTIASPRSYIVATDDGGNYEEIKRRHLRKTVEPDIEFPMKKHDLPDRQQLTECEEQVPHQPEEHAAPNGKGRISYRQTDARWTSISQYISRTM